MCTHDYLNILYQTITQLYIIISMCMVYPFFQTYIGDVLVIVNPYRNIKMYDMKVKLMHE